MGIAASVSGLATEVLEVFERYGLRFQDSEQMCRTIGLVCEAALAYHAQAEQTAPIEPRSHGLTSRQLRLLADMCEDARLCVTAGIETCQRCDRRVCRAHARALSRAESYRNLALQLGAQVAAYPLPMFKTPATTRSRAAGPQRTAFP